MIRYEIRYQYGSYSGTRTVYSDGNDGEAIAQMWRELAPYMSLGVASRGAKVISRQDVPDEDEE